tara:strand:- start:1549 stop:2661 length:1113 start_codon:yes stop_codon:yes gene_type:complete
MSNKDTKLDMAPTLLNSHAWQLEGLDGPVSALRRSIEAGSLAHAYIFHGPRGVGKATLAKRLAQALIAQSIGDSSIDFESKLVQQIETEEFPDIEWVKVGGICDDETRERSTATSRIRICQVRRLQRLAALAPFQSPRRIFVFDTIDDIQTEAGHALLKTLEEPPQHVLLVLLANEIDKVLPTIRSRCREIELSPMAVFDLAEVLESRFSLDSADAIATAREAKGRYGLALSLIKDPSLRMLQATVAEDAVRLVKADRNARLDYAGKLSQLWRRERASVLVTIDFWIAWWQEALFIASGLRDAKKTVPDGDNVLGLQVEDVVLGLHAIRRGRRHLLANVNPQLALEVMMLNLPILRDGSEKENAIASDRS